MITYNFFKYLYLYIRYSYILQKIYREENIIKGLSVLLGVELDQDWVGRLYAVLNPYIKNGKYDPSATVYEFGADNPSEVQIENYVMGHLDIAKKFIINNQLFDLLAYRMEKIDDYQNFLLIFEPAPLPNLLKYTKKMLWLLGFILVGLVIFLIFF